jgi:hypothetical protein
MEKNTQIKAKFPLFLAILRRKGSFRCIQALTDTHVLTFEQENRKQERPTSSDEDGDDYDVLEKTKKLVARSRSRSRHRQQGISK